MLERYSFRSTLEKGNLFNPFRGRMQLHVVITSDAIPQSNCDRCNSSFDLQWKEEICSIPKLYTIFHPILLTKLRISSTLIEKGWNNSHERWRKKLMEWRTPSMENITVFPASWFKLDSYSSGRTRENVRRN